MSVLRAVYLSLAIHLIIYLVINLFPLRQPEVGPPLSVTEIEIINKPFKVNEDGQVVRQTLAPDHIRIEDDTQARFLSEQRQRVILETRARETGLTQNRDAKMPERQKYKDQEHSKDGYEPVRLPRPNEFTEEGSSTVGELLPNDVAVGSFTALNTDRFQFYSFYARVEELIRFRWETQVRTAVDNFDRSYIMTHLGRRNWITQIEFVISPEGHLRASKIMKESGVKNFDAAAVWAFQDARFFPNPPKEMIEDDGFIHLKYSFNVYFEPSALARSAD